jgi:fatty acid desaturase
MTPTVDLAAEGLVEPLAPRLQPPPALLTRAERAAWREPVRWRIVRDLALIWAQAVAGIALYVVYPSAWTMIAGFFLVGGAQHGLMLAGHEFAHGLVLPGHKALNDWIGDWLFVGPGGNSLRLYRQRHFAHHRLVSTAQDTKTIYRRDYSGVRLALEVLRSLSGADYLQQVWMVMRRAGLEASPDAPKLPLVRVLAPPVVSQVAIAAILLPLNPAAYLVLWALPLATAAMLFSKIRSSVEHLPFHAEGGTAPSSGYFMDTAGPFARSVVASRFERLFLSKLNFCYHVEHHLFPGVSYQYLPEVRERLAGREVGEIRTWTRESTYLSTLLKFWRGV